MNVKFYQRDLSRIFVDSGIKYTIKRIAHAAMGGSKTATIEAKGTLFELGELMNRLRCGIVIDNDFGKPVWWGFVSEVKLHLPEMTIAASLDKTFNKVAVAYCQVDAGSDTGGERYTTDWEVDSFSIKTYGIKEMLHSLAESTATHAAAARDTVLEENKYPHLVPSIGSKNDEIKATLICRGWWDTLTWRYAPVPTLLALAYETIGSTEQTIGRATTVDGLVEIFGSGAGFNANHVEMYVGKVGAPADSLQVELCEVAAGVPGTVLESAVVAAASISTTPGWIRFTFSTAPTLTAATDYCVKLSRTGSADAANYYVSGLDPAGGYAGACWIDYNSNYISFTGNDIPFRVLDESAVKQVYYETTTSTKEIGLLTTVTQIAQAFDTSGAAINLFEVEIYVKKVGTPADSLSIAIYTNPDDLTPTTELTSQTIAAASIGTSYAWTRITLSASYSIAANASYFLVISRTGADEPSNYYMTMLDENQGYGAGPFVMELGSAWAVYAADLPWRLYENTYVETSQQVKSLLTNYGQFFGQIFVDDPSGLTTESYRDGDGDAKYEAEELLAAGTVNHRRMLATVDSDRTVRIYEEPAATTCYRMTGNGKLMDDKGNAVREELCKVGVWVKLIDVIPTTVSSQILHSPTMFFIEEAEYLPEEKRLSITARGARSMSEQTRMENG